MKETLFLFSYYPRRHQTRKALQAAGMCFRVADIPRELRGGCRLCIYIDVFAGKEDEWIIAGHTESIYRLENGDWRCLATFPERAEDLFFFIFIIIYTCNITIIS